MIRTPNDLFALRALVALALASWLVLALIGFCLWLALNWLFS